MGKFITVGQIIHLGVFKSLLNDAFIYSNEISTVSIIIIIIIKYYFCHTGNKFL